VVYLLTFILCFDAPWYYNRWVFLPLLLAALAYMAFQLWPGHHSISGGWMKPIAHMQIRGLIAAFAGSLFVACMVCHGELARLKPHPRYLTGFFGTIPLGGAIGGPLLGLLAPSPAHAYSEVRIGLALTALMLSLPDVRSTW